MEISLIWIVLTGVVGLALAVYFFTSSSDNSTTTSGVVITRRPEPKKQEKKDVDDGRPVMKILWGSQTGTAEDFAETLGEEADANGFRPVVIDMEDYDPEDTVDEKFVVLITATYGEGEPTDNAKDFYDWVMEKEDEEDLLKGVKYATFGLGNTTYEHYNKVGKDLDSKFEDLGATRVFARGEGDDDSSLEEDWMKWKEAFLQELQGVFDVKAADGAGGAVRRSKLVEVTSDAPEHVVGTFSKRLQYDHRVPFLARVGVNRELHTEHSDRSCRHIEFVVEDKLRYQAGDHLAVFAKNDSEVVAAAAERLKMTDRLDEVFKLVSIKGGNSGQTVMGPCSYRQAFTSLVDFTSMPVRKKFLKDISEYAADEAEAELLRTLASTDESSLPEDRRYKTWVQDARRGPLDILEAFPSVDVPIDFFLEAAPALTQRYYSISSSPRDDAARISITSVVVQYDTPAGRHHKGVASNWFLDLDPSEGASEAEQPAVAVYVRESSFRMPKDPSVPIVMVGPGTGLAPFRGFLQERRHQWSTLGAEGVGETVLFFGCRHPEEDFLYEDELRAAETEGWLRLELAFSRQKRRKVYVQNLMATLGEEIGDMIANRGGYFYICGDAAQMAPAVRAELAKILAAAQGKSEAEADEFITDLNKAGRYQTDVWF